MTPAQRPCAHMENAPERVYAGIVGVECDIHAPAELSLLLGVIVCRDVCRTCRGCMMYTCRRSGADKGATYNQGSACGGQARMTMPPYTLRALTSSQARSQECQTHAGWPVPHKHSLKRKPKKMRHSRLRPSLVRCQKEGQRAARHVRADTTHGRVTARHAWMAASSLSFGFDCCVWTECAMPRLFMPLIPRRLTRACESVHRGTIKLGGPHLSRARVRCSQGWGTYMRTCVGATAGCWRHAPKDVPDAHALTSLAGNHHAPLASQKLDEAGVSARKRALVGLHRVI
jgi:hypothetical protein